MNFKKITQSQSTFEVTEPGEHVFYMHNYSGELTVNIQVPNAEVYIFGLYIGKKADAFELHTNQNHKVGGSVSDLLIKGVFYDDAKFVYEGLIRIEEGAHKSNAYQKNQNLVMSKNTFVDSRPFLEILADDVRCTHGSTTGKLSQNQMLYLMTRGLHADLAEEVLVKGFVKDIFNRMGHIDSDLMRIYDKEITHSFSI